ncbi:MAG: hypothetical protein ACYCXW_24065, partial [Solirubrobacteraceae bacterium]
LLYLSGLGGKELSRLMSAVRAHRRLSHSQRWIVQFKLAPAIAPMVRADRANGERLAWALGVTLRDNQKWRGYAG